jgi:hypothetical protein
VATLIQIGALTLDKDRIESVDYRDGKAAIRLHGGQVWTFPDPGAVRRALLPWMAAQDGERARLRALLVEAKAQALRADQRLGAFAQARGESQRYYREAAEAWVAGQLGEIGTE